MINVIRESNVPSSLSTPEIKSYLDAWSKHKEDPDNNIMPTISISYRSSNLLKAFDKSFYSKCYLTESKYINSWVMDVEHFIPKCEDSSLVYNWDNLYPADHSANMSKANRTPSGGYLDPCHNSDDVEQQILVLSLASIRAIQVIKKKLIQQIY